VQDLFELRGLGGGERAKEIALGLADRLRGLLDGAAAGVRQFNDVLARRHGSSYPRYRGRIQLELGDVQGHQVAVLDLVAERGESQGVAAGAAPDVRDDSGRRRKAARHDFRRSDELQLTTAVAQPLALFASLVIRPYDGLFRVHSIRR
jgi:hypothetical protein